MLGAAFPEKERGRAVGTWSAGTAIATAIGPALGGWLVQTISWRAVFIVNLPLAAVVVWIAQRRVPESRNPDSGPLDLAGAVLATAGLGLLVFGLIEAPTAGWASLGVWVPLAAGRDRARRVRRRRDPHGSIRWCRSVSSARPRSRRRTS